MSTPKVRVETVVGEGGYREPANELRVSADARTGLTRRWRKFPAFMGEVVTSAMRWAGLFSMVTCFSAAVLAVTGANAQWVLASVCLAVLSFAFLRSGKRLEHRRRKWRDARRAHDESVLIIGRNALRVGERTIQKAQLTGVRVEKQESMSPGGEGGSVEVRYNVVLDIQGAKPVSALEALQEHELADVLSALKEGGLEVER